MAVKFTENGRSRLSLILAIISWILIFASLSLLLVGLYVRFKVTEFTNLVKDYDGDTVPYVLIAVGGIGALNNLAGGFFAHTVSNPLKRKRFLTPLFLYMVSTLVIGGCMAAAGVMCFMHVKHLDESFHGGLTKAMTMYRGKELYKTEIDELQELYECCGNKGYSDWFELTWKKAERSKGDNVPYSCCSPHALRPCIHTAVHTNSKHLNYDYKTKVTLHTNGCRDAVMEYFGTILNYAGKIILIICILQMLVALVTRFLQTAMAEAEKNVGDKLGPSIGYLLAPGKAKAQGNVDVENEVRNAMNEYDSDDPLYQNVMSDAYMTEPSGPPPPPPPPPPLLKH